LACQEFSIRELWRKSGGGVPEAIEGLRTKFASSRQRQGGVGAKPPALGDFCNFSLKITHFYAYVGLSNYFKSIDYQLKIFEKQSKRTK